MLFTLRKSLRILLKPPQQGLISFLSALYRLLIAPTSSAPTHTQRNIFDPHLLWLVVLCLGEFAVAEYIRSFWAAELEETVPLKTGTDNKFSESEVHRSHNMEVMRLCDDLACLWAVAAGLAYFGY